ncbi:patatin-like phospholipase family protein [Haloplasma contractile]|uniref:Esterase of the alpha-beta hydrolase superfamily ral function prediction only protein n=1 Tax=Haloplasma contractile SSD-17B TaxID=1033810 RepID=F7PU49_9MOLU|nr:patatin family protein [Haloplasma contractile]ERJ11773.1 putative esterase of the alpha-beta hydrolase superfamily ral function prediction only protein [Haloplasma contractile SSD-17B]
MNEGTMGTEIERYETALVVEGGAMRGIFSTGVMDAFIKHDFNPFDLCIGVSAGSTNLAAYIGGMFERNYTIYTDYSVRDDFISWKKFIRGGHLVDLDWMWDISIKEMPLDLEQLKNSSSAFFIGVTSVETGEPVYLTPTEDTIADMIKASSCIPIFYRNTIQLDGVNYVDGGLSDPIPVIEAYNRGAKKIMVIRSRPKSYIMKPKSSMLQKFLFRKTPQLYKTLKDRANRYQKAIDFMRTAPDHVEIIEVNPPETFKTSRLTKDKAILDQDYRHGLEIGEELVKSWKKEL